jgi:A/G-specific adenine glycosylase
MEQALFYFNQSRPGRVLESMETAAAASFAALLRQWKSLNPRPLPWKGERDPYLIWLSEIILQQTRVDQGLAYFERFRQRFPDVRSLALAADDEVFKLWEGLGYYSRARNMLQTARYIAGELDGEFPDTYEGLKSLKGVGPYTAAAIASFAFGLPHAVVDGNVYRVLSRVFGIDVPIDSTDGKKAFGQLAQQLLDPSDPGSYNQAIMDFGAIQCKPAAPLCGNCPMREDCVAFQQKKVKVLPVKSKKLNRKTRYFQYLLLSHNDRVLLRKRTGRDIWQNLYDFPLVETTGLEVELDHIQSSPVWHELAAASGARLRHRSRPFQQALTHQQIVAQFWEFELEKPWLAPEGTYVAEERKNLFKFAFPKIVDWYLKDNSLFL